VGASHGVNERLVALYKRRRGGYARLLLDQRDLTAIGRLSRGVAAVARLDRARFEAHRRRIRAEREALAELEARRTTVAAAEREARTAREALDRAIAAHSRRIDALDAERDLAARYAGELQVARAALDRRVADLPAAPAPVTSRFARGALDWPVAGRVIAAFGPGTDPRTGASVARNGIDLAAPAGSAVIAVGDGLVSFAAPFVGFGSLVIVEHGSGTYTLYGYLTDLAVTEGTTVRRGTTVGHSGRTPTGIEALYFELRIDGRPVDPVQWLRSSR
jgi:septal ring factor EnvC (AmiA/AmiB activator)